MYAFRKPKPIPTCEKTKSRFTLWLPLLIIGLPLLIIGLLLLIIGLLLLIRGLLLLINGLLLLVIGLLLLIKGILLLIRGPPLLIRGLLLLIPGPHINQFSDTWAVQQSPHLIPQLSCLVILVIGDLNDPSVS